MLSYLSYEKKLNLKNFVNFFNYKIVFQRLVTASSIFHVDLAGLKKGLKILGLPFSDEISQESREGMDDEDGSYNFETAMRSSMSFELKAIDFEKNHFGKNETDIQKENDNEKESN